MAKKQQNSIVKVFEKFVGSSRSYNKLIDSIENSKLADSTKLSYLRKVKNDAKEKGKTRILNTVNDKNKELNNNIREQRILKTTQKKQKAIPKKKETYVFRKSTLKNYFQNPFYTGQYHVRIQLTLQTGETVIRTIRMKSIPSDKKLMGKIDKQVKLWSGANVYGLSAVSDYSILDIVKT